MKSIKTFGFAMLAAVTAVLSSGTLAMAAEGEGSMGQSGMIALSAGIAIAGAAFGAAFGQGRAWSQHARPNLGKSLPQSPRIHNI